MVVFEHISLEHFLQSLHISWFLTIPGPPDLLILSRLTLDELLGNYLQNRDFPESDGPKKTSSCHRDLMGHRKNISRQFGGF